MASIEIHKNKDLQLCLRALLLRGDCTPLIKKFVSGDDMLSLFEPKALIQQMRDECREDEQYTIDQLSGIEEMLLTVWMIKDDQSEYLEYSQTPTIYNVLLHFVDQDTLKINDNTNVVCNWESLLRWHTLSSDIGEDLLVCAYLASYDLKNILTTTRRNNFAWPSYIRTDDPTLETMLEMPLADIHAHLKGSSLNFDINWLCLMNHVDGRVEQFKELAEFAQGCHRNKLDSADLYRKVIVAAAIRLYLTQLTIENSLFSIGELKKVLRTFCDGTILNSVDSLQQSIESALEICWKRYNNVITGDSNSFDYGIREGVTVPRGKQEKCAYSLLSGERYMLYSILLNIYKGVYHDGRISALLYIYLLIKNEIRHEISQLNDTVGFRNFSIYEERKLLFVKGYSAYKKAAIHLAVASFFGEHSNGSRYHEARITPEINDEGKDNVVDKNIEEIDFYDNAIEDEMFKNGLNTEDSQWSYRYIYHFIKQQDDTKKDYYNIVPRHHHLREMVKEQAQGIYDLRNSLRKNRHGVFYADRIVGIDAANSEIYCRPEVFAQAFRFLRRHPIIHKEHRPADLGITYHVGEDFMDVVDGLRAVDETILFLQLQKGDRIGHGLVLGVDVDKYYKIRNYTVTMSLQMQMDNAAWLWNCMTMIGIRRKCKEKLERSFGECFRRIYPHYGGTPGIDLYFSSMLLRGDNPECYDADGKVRNPYDRVTGWGSKAFVRTKVCDEARRQREACKLYHLYHYSKEGKINGGVFDTWEVDKDICKTIDEVQQHILQKVEEMGIAIECNPTSNFKIGEIDRYDEHPITKLNTLKRQNQYPRHNVSVSINTDDKGVFATSIEREYALIAHALIRRYRQETGEIKDNDVYDWLDKIRLNSLDQRFDKTIRIQEPSEKHNLMELKQHVGEEVENEIRSRRFVERLKYCVSILFGNKKD